MKTCAALLVVSLSGCQHQAYQQYAESMARIAEAQAGVQREQAQMMMRLAEFSTDSTTRTVAVIMLGMGSGKGFAGNNYVNPQPPQNDALEWARILIPSLVPITLGLWNYRNTKDASQNAATTAQASYAAIFGVAKEGFAAAGSNITTNVTETTTTNTTTSLTASGGSVIGSGSVNPPLTPTQLLGFGP